MKHKFEDTGVEYKKRFDDMRLAVLEELDGDGLNEVGRPENSIKGMVHTINRGTDYTRKRLKRSHPALYQQVVKNVLTPHAAGKEAGFIKTRQRFMPGDVDQTIRQLRKYFDDEGLEALSEAITNLLARKTDNPKG